MRDYVSGAFEALSWIKELFLDNKTRCQGCRVVIEELKRALEEIRGRAADDFLWHIKRD